MVSQKKAQLESEVFKYLLVGVVSIIILVTGYKMVNVVRERICTTELAKFEIDLRNIDKSLRYGTKELQSYDAPCKVDKIYFFDTNKKINPEDFKDVPLIKDRLKSASDNNVFLVKENEVKRSFYAGNLEMLYPYNICFVPKFDKISFYAEGGGKSAKITGACNQPECTFIPQDISEELSKKIIKEAVDFGCRNCPNDFDAAAKNIKLTRQNVEVFRKFLFCDGITDVQIVIRPKKGSILRDFRFYEFIPKTCIDDLNKYLAENIEGEVDVKGDPLIMWHFSDLGEEKKISYKLNAALDDECKQAIQGLGAAEFVKGQNEERQVTGPNTAPTIGGLPAVAISGTGLKKNVLGLWKYSQDRETNSKSLVYTIIDQTRPDLVDCKINEEKDVDCEVKQNKDGVSTVTIHVDDLEFRDRASFDVKVSQFCQPHAAKGCVGDTISWLDSCGNQQEFINSCASDEICNDGECEKSSGEGSKKCKEGKKCGFLKLGKCKKDKCCEVDSINPFC